MWCRCGCLLQPLWGHRTKRHLSDSPYSASRGACAGHAHARRGHPATPGWHSRPSPSLLPPCRTWLLPQEAQRAQPEPPTPAPCQGQHPRQPPLPSSDPRLASLPQQLKKSSEDFTAILCSVGYASALTGAAFRGDVMCYQEV